MKLNLKIISFALFFTNIVYGYCSQPSEPWCIKYDFKDKYDFENCRIKIKTFIQENQEYSNCVICEFNCKANGETFCGC